MDDHKYPIVERGYEISAGYREHLENMGVFGLAGTTIDQVDLFYNKCIGIIGNELLDMGIQFVDPAGVYEDAEMVTLLLTLRELFDKENFAKSLTGEKFKKTVDAFINSYIGDDDLYLTNLIELCYESKPLSMKWGSLYKNRFAVLNTKFFIDHIVAITNLEIEEPDDVIVQRMKFIKTAVRHIELVKVGFTTIVSSIKGSYTFDDEHDSDLQHMPHDAVTQYLEMGPPYFLDSGIEDCYFVVNHKSSKRHHLEFFIARPEIEPTEEDLILLAAEYAADSSSETYYDDVVSKLLEKTQFSEENKTKFIGFFIYANSIEMEISE